MLRSGWDHEVNPIQGLEFAEDLMFGIILLVTGCLAFRRERKVFGGNREKERQLAENRNIDWRRAFSKRNHGRDVRLK
jgi:hypothetical protein